MASICKRGKVRYVLYYANGKRIRKAIDICIDEGWVRKSTKYLLEFLLQKASTWNYTGQRADRDAMECYARWLNDLSTSYPELVKELFQLAPGVETLYGYQKYAIAKDEHGRYIVKEICR